jgi:hypothetical protein
MKLAPYKSGDVAAQPSPCLDRALLSPAESAGGSKRRIPSLGRTHVH